MDLRRVMETPKELEGRVGEDVNAILICEIPKLSNKKEDKKVKTIICHCMCAKFQHTSMTHTTTNLIVI